MFFPIILTNEGTTYILNNMNIIKKDVE